MALGGTLALGLAACSGKSGNVTGPSTDPEPNDPGPGTELPAGSYVLEQINDSKPGQLVTISNPDGEVIALYRFEATKLIMDALGSFALQLRYTDDIKPFGIDDQGGFDQAGPVSQQGALPLRFNSLVYDDSFTGVVLGDIVAIKYDIDGDGQPDTSFGFRRQVITLPGE